MPQGHFEKEASIGWALLLVVLLAPAPTKADEGGVSFWLPGLFGSLAAVPPNPGLAFSTIYIHQSIGASGGATFVKGGGIAVGLEGRGNLVAFGPSYTFDTTLFGGRPTLSFFGTAGRLSASVDATLVGPMGNAISGHRDDARTAFGDALWQANVNWNRGVNNFMVYATGNFPVGAYDQNRLANLGSGHWALDSGAGYTYFNPSSGYEFSAVAGLTYNFVNPHTDYKNGIDFHVDWGASKFLTPNVQIGLVGYAYQQLTGDTGSGATLGPIRSRVFGIGPQLGFTFAAWEGYQGYINIKAYREFEAEHRPEGWNAWLTLAFSPKAPGEKSIATPRVRK